MGCMKLQNLVKLKYNVDIFKTSQIFFFICLDLGVVVLKSLNNWGGGALREKSENLNLCLPWTSFLQAIEASKTGSSHHSWVLDMKEQRLYSKLLWQCSNFHCSRGKNPLRIMTQWVESWLHFGWWLKASRSKVNMCLWALCMECCISFLHVIQLPEVFVSTPIHQLCQPAGHSTPKCYVWLGLLRAFKEKRYVTKLETPKTCLCPSRQVR